MPLRTTERFVMAHPMTQPTLRLVSRAIGRMDVVPQLAAARTDDCLIALIARITVLLLI